MMLIAEYWVGVCFAIVRDMHCTNCLSSLSLQYFCRRNIHKPWAGIQRQSTCSSPGCYGNWSWFTYAPVYGNHSTNQHPGH